MAFDRSNYLDDQHRSHTTQINDVESVPWLRNYVPIIVNNHKVHAMLDSGADISVVDISVFDKYHLSDICQIYKSDREYISTASQNKMFIKGRVK